MGVWAPAVVRQYWLAGSVVFGPALGAVGAAIRWPGPVGLVGALVVPVGAALQMVVVPLPAESRMAVPVTVTVWCAAAVAVVLAVRPRRGTATG